MTPVNTMRNASTGMGKSQATAYDVVHSPDDAHIIADPAKDSLAEAVLTHAPVERILYDRLSNLENCLGYGLLERSTEKNPSKRESENERRQEAFLEILLRRREKDSMASSPLMEEWITAALSLYFHQSVASPIANLPFAFMPGTPEFEALLCHCTKPEIVYKFRQLERLTPRALRAEIGSASRFINSVFRSRHFLRRAFRTFDLGQFLQNKGILILERGDEMSSDAMRVIIGAVITLTIEHARSRPKPYPHIFVHIDECTSERLAGQQEVRGAATTRKAGLFWDFLDQNNDFQGFADSLQQNCRRHEWMGCARYDLARKAAIDIVAGLPPSPDVSKAEQVEMLTRDVMNLSPGWRWVRDSFGSRKEYVPLLQHPWPDWPGLREAKLREKLRWIYSRPEYQRPEEPPSESGSVPGTPPAPKSPKSFSPAARLKVLARKQAVTSSKNENEKPSESAE